MYGGTRVVKYKYRKNGISYNGTLKIVNIAKVNRKKVDGAIKAFRVYTCRTVQPGDKYGQLPRRRQQSWCKSGNIATSVY